VPLTDPTNPDTIPTDQPRRLRRFLTSTDTSVTAPGVAQLKWARAGNATAGRDVLVDEIQVTRLGS
jgi:hypothetical protein